jgi:hypothetical protein
MIRQGTWCDLARRPNDVAFVRTLRSGEVVCETAESTPLTIWRRALPGGELLYLSAAADSTGLVGVIGKSQSDGHARLIIDGEHLIDLDETAAIFGTLLVGHVDGFTAYVLRTASMYEEIRLTRNGDRLSTTPRTILELSDGVQETTSQGFLQVLNGRPVLQDGPARIQRGLSLPSRAGSVWAGQSRSSATIALYDETTEQITPLGTRGGQPPHIIDALDGSYYVCSWIEDGSWWERLRRPFAAALPPIEPPPVTPPVEPPKETPVRLEPRHSDLIEAFAARFPPPGGNEDALRDHWTPKLVEQMVFSFPGEGWCWKSTSRGSRPSSDVIARQVNGGMWGYDLIPDAGTPRWRLDAHAGPIDLRTQAPIAMAPVNHLGEAPPVTPPTQPPTQPPVTPPAQAVDLSPVLAELRALRGDVQALRESHDAHERASEQRYENHGDQHRLMNEGLAQLLARR